MNPTLSPSPPAAASLEQLPLFRAADRWVVRFRVASETDPRVSYTVAVDAAGRWGCSCPAWIYDPERRPCKHVRSVQAAHGDGGGP